MKVPYYRYTGRAVCVCYRTRVRERNSGLFDAVSPEFRSLLARELVKYQEEGQKLVPGRDCLASTQQTAKGAMVKHLMKLLYEVMSRTGVSAGPHNEMRFSLFHHWQCFEQVCARNGRFQPPAEIELVAAHVEKALLAQHTLKAEANSQDSLTWHLLPKNT